MDWPLLSHAVRHVHVGGSASPEASACLAWTDHALEPVGLVGVVAKPEPPLPQALQLQAQRQLALALALLRLEPRQPLEPPQLLEPGLQQEHQLPEPQQPERQLLEPGMAWDLPTGSTDRPECRRALLECEHRQRPSWCLERSPWGWSGSD